MLREDLVDDNDADVDRTATARDRFLLDEGLELLATYRRIGDPEARRSVRQFVALMGEGHARKQ